MPSLKDRYEAYLNGSISRQCAQTKIHQDNNRDVLACNRNSAGFSDAARQLCFTLESNRAEGAYVYDLDGNKYLDLSMGFGVHLFGHAPQFLREAIEKQLRQSSSLGPLSPIAADCARLITEMSGTERCCFFNSGTEAVMVALRLARAAKRKNKVVILEGGYHGTHDSLLLMKTHPSSFESVTTIPGVPQSFLDETILLPYDPDKIMDYISSHHSSLAAILIEPVQSRHPERRNEIFLKSLEQVCRENDVAFILDEVITGFRVSNGGASQIFGLKPDLVIYGKVLGGGMPIGVVAGSRHYLDFIDGGQWSFDTDSGPDHPTTFVAGTFCHHPITMAATLATLQLLKSEANKIQQQLTQTTQDFCSTINEFCRQHHISIQLEYFGSQFRFLLKGRQKVFYHCLLKEGVYLWEGRNAFFSTSHGPEELQFLERRIKKCLIEMKAAGYFNSPADEPLSEQTPFYFTAALELEETLDEEWLALAFRYTAESLGEAAGRKFTYRYAKKGEGEIEEGESGHIILYYLDGKLILKVLAAELDGWSMTVFLSHLSKSYAALEQYKKLPDIPTWNSMDPWLNTKKDKSYSRAETIHRSLPIQGRKPHFEELLAAFAMALGTGRHQIGVPLSGQLLSRNIRAIGPLTRQVTLDVEVTNEWETVALQQQIKLQLAAHKKISANGWKGEGPHAGIVFNLDNLTHEFQFAGRKVKMLPADDLLTAHAIVCNVMMDVAVLHVALKFRKGEDSSVINQLLENFCTILNLSHVPAAGTYS